MNEAKNLGELLGVEGNGAAIYFAGLGAMLRGGDGDGRELQRFEFENRNRRPATDPVNAMLSFAYAMLVRELTSTPSAVGFDPYRGFYHQPRYGRPALALDIMEPFRPILADSAVITAINNGEVNPGDFIRAGQACALSPSGRKKMITTFERRLAQEITHPVFGYRLSYHRLLEVQARLLGRHLMGENSRTAGGGAPMTPVRGGERREVRQAGDENLYIVTYDISSQRRWRRVFRIMEGYGEWVQLSVFQCRLSRRRRIELKLALEETINHAEDHVIILDLGPAATLRPRVESLGKSFSVVERSPVIV